MTRSDGPAAPPTAPHRPEQLGVAGAGRPSRPAPSCARWPPGAVLAGGAVRAGEVHLCLPRNREWLIAVIQDAVAEPQRTGVDPVRIEVHDLPHNYVSSEESALVHWLNGGEAKPTATPPRPFERGVGQRPTLIDNVETLATIALIARFGPAWFRRAGLPDAPGTMLSTDLPGRASQRGTAASAPDTASAGYGGVAVKHRLAVNPIARTGHGLCAEMLPEVIRLDEWGFPIVSDRAIPHDLSALARRAVRICPELAPRLDPAAADRKAAAQ